MFFGAQEPFSSFLDSSERHGFWIVAELVCLLGEEVTRALLPCLADTIFTSA